MSGDLGRTVVTSIGLTQGSHHSELNGRSVALDIPIDGSLHVLYGLNGAGKSISLEALRDGLQGGAGAMEGCEALSVVVHVQVQQDVSPDWDGDDEFWTAIPLTFAIDSAISGWVRGAPSAATDAGVPPQTLGVARRIIDLRSTVSMQEERRCLNSGEAVPPHIAQSAARARERLLCMAADIAAQRRFALVNDRSGWRVSIACALDDTTPILMEEMRLPVTSWQQYCDRAAEIEGPIHSAIQVASEIVVPTKRAMDQARDAAYADHLVRCAESLVVTPDDFEFVTDLEHYLSNFDRSRLEGVTPPPFYWEHSQDGLVSSLSHFDRPPFVVMGEPGADVDVRTRLYLANQTWIEESEVFEPDMSDAEVRDAGDLVLAVASSSLGDRATEILSALLPHAPRLVCSLLDRDQQLRGETGLWRAELGGDVTLELTELSFATERLARVAIELALAEHLDPDALKVLLLDEPDLGLHRLAERQLFLALRDLATHPDLVVIAASHSPTPFALEGVKMHHVRRRPDGAITVTQLSAPGRQGLEALGLSVSDLLPVVRVFLLVEGRHDEILLSALFADGPEGFERAGVHLLAMHGGRKATSVVDSALLWDYTDAKVAVLLDRVAAEALAVLWNEVLVRALTERPDHLAAWFRETARATLQGEITGNGKATEIDWIVTLGSRAIERGVTHRLVPMGHPADDILAYLPEGSLGAPTWQAAKRKGLVTDERLLSAVGSLDTIPPDLAAIHRACIDLAL